MSEAVLELRNITKSYNGKRVSDGIDMTIKRGDIYGLIGRNGAGKTTLTRLIASLSKPDHGELSLFGETTEKGLLEARRRMGCVIEMPALYPHLTAKQNLAYYQKLKGIPERDAVDKVLDIVGLTDTGKKKFKHFSLGMKQRLGIALALLGSPDFLILDEPTNGLDPMGIVEMREFIKRLNVDFGITILISSHLLGELSLLATRYGILEQGKMVKELTAEELAEACKESLSIVVENTAKAAQILETHLNTTNFKLISDTEIRLYDGFDNPADINYLLVQNGIRVQSIQAHGANLEDYFMELVGGNPHA